MVFVKITPVKTRRDRNKFILFPYSFYQNDPAWIPPLRSELKAQFDPKTNPLLDHCDFQLFLLEHEDQIIGRVAAFIDHLAVDFWGERIGLFGYYECVPDQEAALLLLQAAADWLHERGMDSMRGPWTFVSQEWGVASARLAEFDGVSDHRGVIAELFLIEEE
jgi:hypothetical protein